MICKIITNAADSHWRGQSGIVRLPGSVVMMLVWYEWFVRIALVMTSETLIVALVMCETELHVILKILEGTVARKEVWSVKGTATSAKYERAFVLSWKGLLIMGKRWCWQESLHWLAWWWCQDIYSDVRCVLSVAGRHLYVVAMKVYCVSGW